MTGDRGSKRHQHPPLFSRVACATELRLPLPQGLNGGLETEPAWRLTRFLGRLDHQQANRVVGDEVHQDFFLHHLLGTTAQYVHAHRGFDVAKEQFDIPALEIQVR